MTTVNDTPTLYLNRVQVSTLQSIFELFNNNWHAYTLLMAWREAIAYQLSADSVNKLPMQAIWANREPALDVVAGVNWFLHWYSV